MSGDTYFRIEKDEFFRHGHHLRYDNVENFYNIIFQGVLCKCFVLVIHEKGMQVNGKYMLMRINLSKFSCYLHAIMAYYHGYAFCDSNVNIVFPVGYVCFAHFVHG